MLEDLFASDFLILLLICLAVIGAVAVVVWRFWLKEPRDPYRRDWDKLPQVHGGRLPAGGAGRSPEQVKWGYEQLGSDSKRRDQEIEQLKTRLMALERTVEQMGRELTAIHRRSPGDSAGAQIVRHSVEGAYGDPRHYVNSSPVALSSPESAKDAYRRMVSEGLRGLPVEPVFASLDMESGNQVSAIGEVKRSFKQSGNKQSPFVIFQKDSAEGWLFPNPRITFTEGMTYVFPDMSYENFEEAKVRVEPRSVRRTAADVWEMLDA